MMTSFFDITTNLVVGCIPGREGGGVFKDDKIEFGKYNNDKDNNKVHIWGGVLHWASAKHLPMGGG